MSEHRQLHTWLFMWGGFIVFLAFSLFPQAQRGAIVSHSVETSQTPSD